MEHDAGLLFICRQRDPRAGFIKLFDRMSTLDMLNQFVAHAGGGLFACRAARTRDVASGRRCWRVKPPERWRARAAGSIRRA